MRLIERTAILAVVLAAAVSATPAFAVTLSDGNSSLSINPTSTAVGGSNVGGLDHWYIQGTDQIFQQWFWYRIGNTGGEHILSGLPVSVVNTSASTATLSYQGSGFTVDLTYSLIGGPTGSGTARIDQAVAIHNNGASALDLHFFEYSDFDVNGSAGGDSASINPGGNAITQSDGPFTITDAIEMTPPSHWQIGASGTGYLDDANPSTLADAAASYGPGDAAFGFEWDQGISAGGTLQISQKITVPDGASTSMLLGAATLGVAFVKTGRRRG